MLINNDQQLRELIPNVFSNVKGEAPLFEKLAPFLSSAEQWLIRNFASQKTFNTICGYTDDNQTKTTAERIIVCEALRNAVPSLDLVLTPNGFGVVSNQNIAPASKERVARLINSLTAQRDDLLEVFMPMLVGASKWKESEQYRFFSATLFPNINLSTLCGFNSNRWEKYLVLREQIIGIEASLADEFVSPELMNELRKFVIDGNSNENIATVIRGIKSQVVDVLKGSIVSTRHMIDIVNIIRNNPDDFPQWHNSATAKLFSPPKFTNKKENKGYWF